jgi:hypothetical protein
MKTSDDKAGEARSADDAAAQVRADAGGKPLFETMISFLGIKSDAMEDRLIREHNTPIDTTGLPSLDQTINGVLAGDNIVWHVDRIDDYRAFVLPYAEAAVRDKRTLVYFRFARHKPLLPDDFPCTRHVLKPGRASSPSSTASTRRSSTPAPEPTSSSTAFRISPRTGTRMPCSATSTC